ncbi:hypothetical protein [Phaeobacter inhibens]|uniref:hypothetical protein n=1 Tax=Phaeobacter inhibens TaxID=221822 RepID=UPI00295ED9C7|nr:hypothetical protein [Phaeobacter inhibens]
MQLGFIALAGQGFAKNHQATARTLRYPKRGGLSQETNFCATAARKTELVEAGSLREFMPFRSRATSASLSSELPVAQAEAKRQAIFGLQTFSHPVDAQRNEMLSAKKQDAGKRRYLV